MLDVPRSTVRVQKEGLHMTQPRMRASQRTAQPVRWHRDKSGRGIMSIHSCRLTDLRELQRRCHVAVNLRGMGLGCGPSAAKRAPLVARTQEGRCERARGVRLPTASDKGCAGRLRTARSPVTMTRIAFPSPTGCASHVVILCCTVWNCRVCMAHRSASSARGSQGLAVRQCISVR